LSVVGRSVLAVTDGQRPLTAQADLAALAVCEGVLEVVAADRCAVHGRLLRAAVQLNAVLSRSGMGLASVAQVALLLNVSESQAARLLEDGRGLAELPGGLEAVECALLTPEQAHTVVTQLAVLDLPGRLAVWQRLQERLCLDAERRAVLPPARLTELLRRWVIETDPEGAVERRQAAEQDRRVEYRRREDGLYDLSAFGIAPPLMQAVLQRIRAASQPVGLCDERTADQRRLDAFVDLLLGRDVLGGQAGSGDGCRPGAPLCGAQVNVLIPLRTALGTGDEPAELVGHGPIEPDLAQDLLATGVRLRPVWIDEHGTPVAESSRTYEVRRGDPWHLREQLLRLADLPPPERAPTHPGDHERGQPHPPDTPGPYRPPAEMGRLVKVRAPRCEFPGCGCASSRCDLEHDRAHPDGPTCPCNLGPCCRRHHRIKQVGWVKTRGTGSALRWTSPTTRSWLSPSQHTPPSPAVRPLPPVPAPVEEPEPWEVEDELEHLGLLPPDDRIPEDVEPEPSDSIGDALREQRTQWGLDLDDPYRWVDLART
jgi:hypothetical protein